jgi:hypothetical protein
VKVCFREDKITLPERKEVQIYESVEELWNDYGLTVAKSVLDQPP